MPIYEYECRKCKIIYDLYCPMKDMKKYLICRECGKRATRFYEGQSFRIDMDEPTGKFYHNVGNDKSSALRWHDGAVKATEDALKFDSGVSPYSRMSLNYDTLEKEGYCKKVSTKEADAKKKSTAKMVRDAANNMSSGELDIATRPDRTKSK